jgi:hypothetical protein
MSTRALAYHRFLFTDIAAMPLISKELRHGLETPIRLS